MRVRLPVPALSCVCCVCCVAAAMLAGCGGGSGEGLDSAGRPIVPGSGGGALTSTLQSIQEHVFTPACTSCHAGAAAPRGLRLDAANSHAALVGVPSTEVPSVLRVAPGEPDNSYLIHKLEGTASVGARMPLGGPFLDSATVAVIRQWIADGAAAAAPPSEAQAASLLVGAAAAQSSEAQAASMRPASSALPAQAASMRPAPSGSQLAETRP